VDDLLLWDPVVSGTTYLKEVEQVHREFVDECTGTFPYPDEVSLELDPDERVGFLSTPKLRRQMRAESLLGRDLAGGRGVHIVVSEETEEYRALFEQWDGRGASFEVIPDDGEWNRFAACERALLPSRILNRITTIITESPE
jgi:hypothetical protein